MRCLGLVMGVLLLMVNVAVPLQAAQRVTLGWDANPEPDIAGYKLRYGVRSGSYTNLIDVGNKTNATVSGLATGNVYFFVLTAYNTAALESDYSDEVAFTNAVPGNPVDTGIVAWRAVYFNSADLADASKETTVWGDMADPDGDGQNNLWEYAMGQSPVQNQAQVTGVSVSVEQLSGNSYLCLSFPRRKTDAELQYIPEVSNDRQAWASGSVELLGAPAAVADPEFEQVKYRDLTVITPEQPRFMRLKIVR